MLTKRCLRFVLFYLDLELLSKIKKKVSTRQVFCIFFTMQDLNKKKIAKLFFVDVVNDTLKEKLQTEFNTNICRIRILAASDHSR